MSGSVPGASCEFDTAFVAACAMREITQTSGASSRPLAVLFDELLAPGTNQLVWKGKGPGLGKEMRRAFSGLFGRFFARAYLERYHRFAWFSPIDGNPTAISRRMRVVRLPGKGSELPDWVCGGPKRLAVAEAKGTSQPGTGTGGGKPGPIKTAEGQIHGVVIEKLLGSGNKKRWTALSTKGWAVMSRWGAELPPRDAFLFALDPETRGQPPSNQDRDEMIQDVARSHVGHLLAGMGYGELASTLLVGQVSDAGRPQEGASLDLDGEAETTYLGVPVGPSGILPVSIRTARRLEQDMPGAIKFLGIDTEVIKGMLTGHLAQPRVHRSSGDIQIGADSSVYAPIKRVTPRAVSI
ncbi:hypothetical protein ACNJYD_30790 [Bradyrhizobium sp. DASA03005]|uniref:hypothetical protein n=1 Tax=Bradyrhizobium sp. SPXBL-02 TaxID=3395912 RepID=UPI003F701F2D